MEAGPSAQLARKVEAFMQRLAAGPTALFGGEQAALALLSGPPSRGPPVPAPASGAKGGWRPLDLYVGRNDRLGDPTWGNPFKVGKDGDAAKCRSAYEEWLRTNEVLWQRLAELRGRRLRCHCAPGAPCHSDVLVRLFCEKTAGLEAAAPGLLTSVPAVALGNRRVVSVAVPGTLTSEPVTAARGVVAAVVMGGRCDAAAVSEVGCCASVGSASTAPGGRREASAAVSEVGVCTSGGSA